MSIPKGIMVINGNEPADIAKLLVRALYEFVNNNMPDEQRQEMFGNITNSIADLLLSPEGRLHVTKALLPEPQNDSADH